MSVLVLVLVGVVVRVLRTVSSDVMLVKIVEVCLRLVADLTTVVLRLALAEAKAIVSWGRLDTLRRTRWLKMGLGAAAATEMRMGMRSAW